MTGMSSERKRKQLGECRQEEIFKNNLIKYEGVNAAANQKMNPFLDFLDGEHCV